MYISVIASMPMCLGQILQQLRGEIHKMVGAYLLSTIVCFKKNLKAQLQSSQHSPHLL